jgi:hypothetical protein
MTDIPRVVDDLRSYCQGADQVLSDALRETAAAYRDACQAINQRLRRCEEFLQKGLRSEALHLAESEPPLLDSVATLDFPERSQWDELAATYGLPAAPKLNVATAEALNRAYAEDEPLRRPLREHRRLNIARAPLRDRLAALRRLHQLDAGNPVWPEDIRVFETARHGELGGEVEEAITKRDFAGLSKCWDEVQTTPWLAAPPQALVGRLQGIYLREIGEELYSVYKAQDFPRAQRLRDNWERLDPRAAFGPTNAVWDRVNLCLDWIRREESRQSRRLEFETALMELEQALGKEWTPVERLRELYIQVTDFRIRVPSSVEECYTARVGEIRRKADSKERIILVLSFAVGAIVLVGFLLFAVLRHR